MNQIEKNLSAYIDAGYPIIYINYFDFKEADDLIRKLKIRGVEIIEYNNAYGNIEFEIKKPIRKIDLAEFLRKGRFDELFFVDLPNEDERKKIFEIHLKKRNKWNQSIDILKLVKESDNFNGADIEAVIKESIENAFIDRDNERRYNIGNKKYKVYH